MADLITRLILNTQQFDQNIGKSSKQIQGFQQKIQGFSSGAISAFTKFAGGIGLAISAGEALNKMMRSNQTTSDMFDNNMNAARDSVDAFFRSLTTGDWSVFSNGIIAAFTNLKELSALMDELADKKLSLSYIKAEDLKEIEQYETVAKDTNKSLDERKMAAEKMAMAVKHLSKETADYIKSSEEGLAKTYKANYGVDVDRETLDYFFKHTNKSDSSVLSEIEKYKKERVAIEQKYTTTTTVPSSFGATTISTLSKQGKEALQQYDKQNEFIRTQSVLLEEVDDKRVVTLNALKEQYDMEREIYSLQKRTDETSRSVNTLGGSTKKENIIPEGSIMEMHKKIADLKKDYESATNEGTRAGFMRAIEEYKTHLRMMQLRAAGTSSLSGNISKPTGKSVKSDLDTGKIKIKGVDTDAIQNNLDYADSLNILSTAMSSVSAVTQEGASAWITYSANLLNAVNSSVEALRKQVGAEKAASIASVIAKASALPFPSNLIAIGSSVATVIAALAAIPAFAGGGIFSGNSFIGDNMIARVNSGEMILNNRQQKNLFNLLDGKGGASSLNGGTVEFKLKGKELVGVLNAQASKTNKYK
ncbi:hypothetical protein [Parabacteroides gordonii]|uniref:hypothetical protein n=1 Tax=Parabacteroides gordonii TaxID=574930 RepID=UPI0026EBD725|nr:hypothetical protein [Parabacteroides gordonii]